MFWSANFVVVRELNFLLKEENVTLAQVLETDDILQECKADNKALIQFITKPEILAELITLITEEPSKYVGLTNQYRHAHIACEVLTSHLSMLSDRLSLDTVQMNRLCDFINKDPPLNPLLASYFSKTVEMLLERSPKQDWYLYHIVCLRVLDFFKSRRDFLPNLLRHMSTSAIADIFKYFIRLDELFKKTVMEWLEEHQFLECLIQIICGTYVPEELPPPVAKPEVVEPQRDGTEATSNNKEEVTDSGGEPDADKEKVPTSSRSGSASPQLSGNNSNSSNNNNSSSSSRQERIARVAASNAAALLADLVLTGCAGEGCTTRPRTSWSLVERVCSERCVRALLCGMFTSPPHMRTHALVHGSQLLLALLTNEPALTSRPGGTDECRQYGEAPERSAVELAAAPHLPLLHHALLHDPSLEHESSGPAEPERVGAARLQVAALLAHLALSEVDEVASTMLTLGTPGVLLDMFFRYSQNNFLHAHVYTLVKHALTNTVHRAQYARHLFIECDLLTRLMDAFEQNRDVKEGVSRAAYMGHVILMLSRVARALSAPDALPSSAPLPPAVAARWELFVQDTLRQLLQQFDTPLGGYYPSENIYEVEVMADTVANYDYNEPGAPSTMDEFPEDVHNDDGPEMCGSVGPSVESADFILEAMALQHSAQRTAAQNSFLELASQRFDDDMWDDLGESDAGAQESESPADEVLEAARDVLEQTSPWEGGESASSGSEGAGAGAGAGGEGWAQFGADAFCAADNFWPSSDTTATEPGPSTNTEEPPSNLRLEDGEGEKTAIELANKLLTAMSSMSPDAIANIVNANMAEHNS